jgi:hypothetical protein
VVQVPKANTPESSYWIICLPTPHDYAIVSSLALIINFHVLLTVYAYSVWLSSLHPLKLLYNAVAERD